MSTSIFIYSTLSHLTLQERIDATTRSRPADYAHDYLVGEAKPVDPRQAEIVAEDFGFPAQSRVIVRINNKERSAGHKEKAISHLVSDVSQEEVLLLLENESIYAATAESGT